MPRDLVMRVGQHCRQLTLPRSGIVVALGTCAAILLLCVRTFPVNQQFQVVSINGEKLPTYRRHPTFKATWIPILIERASGNGGCNGWSAQFRVTGKNRFQLGEGYQTAMSCGPQQDRIEDDFIRVLRNAERWHWEGAELVLESEHGTVRLTPIAQDDHR